MTGVSLLFRTVSRWAPTVLVLLLGGNSPAVAEWRQWRGTEGLGVASDETPLPERWETGSANIRWRTEIPGEGISSPIVSDGRVFVTTAYEGSGGRRQLLLGVAAAGLALLFLALAWRGRGSGSRLVLGVSLVFLVVAVAMALAPDLFFEEGNPGRAWRIGGGAALLGLAAAFGWARRESSWRLAGAALVVVGAALLVYLAPSGPLGPAGLSERLGPAVPALALALGYAIRALRGRAAPPGAGGQGALAGLPLALLAALVFVPPNFLSGLQRVVVAVDAGSGEILWQRPVFTAPSEQKWDRSTYATPTPATDGEHVFAYFGAGVASVDFDGSVEWVERFPRYSKHTRYGAAASPVLSGDSVILVQESEAHQDGPASWVGAFDKRSGRALWRVQPPEAHDSYTTPMVVSAGPRPRLLLASWHHLLALDAGSGERVWTHEYPMEQMVASFGRAGDLLVVTGGVYGDKLLIALRIGADGPEELWRTNRGVATIASPVVYRGLVFALTDGGIMTCYDAETGREHWKQRLDGSYFASLVAGDGKVYAINTEGATTVIAAEPVFRKLAVNRLDGSAYASPAIADGGLVVRTARHLFFIEAGPEAVG